MIPLIVSQSDRTGGAARAASRLTKALRGNGVEANMLVASKMGDEFYVAGPDNRVARMLAPLLPRINKILTSLQSTTNPILHSLNIIPGCAYRQIEKSAADIINLHWVNKEMLSIASIGRITKPVVFTLHDMWAFCGSEHLSPDDGMNARFRLGYVPHNRPRGHKGLDLDRWAWERKQKFWTHPRHVICPSNWLARCAQESALMKKWPVHVVPNPLDVSTFQPLDRRFCRKVLGLPVDVPLIAFNGIGNDYNKGFDLLAAALRIIAASDQISGVECVVFGQNEAANSSQLGLPLRFAGRFYDDCSLALLYNAVDVVVVPSRQENLSQTATEAQSCGTPVVAFNAAGLPDTISHRETGYLASVYEPEDLAQGIRWVLGDAARYTQLAESARRRAIRLWAPEVVVPQYLEVYQQAMNGT